MHRLGGEKKVECGSGVAKYGMGRRKELRGRGKGEVEGNGKK